MANSEIAPLTVIKVCGHRQIIHGAFTSWDEVKSLARTGTCLRKRRIRSEFSLPAEEIQAYVSNGMIGASSVFVEVIVRSSTLILVTLV